MGAGVSRTIGVALDCAQRVADAAEDVRDALVILALSPAAERLSDAAARARAIDTVAQARASICERAAIRAKEGA